MNQIKNIQVGNQTYQIGGTGSGSTGGGSTVTRGELFISLLAGENKFLCGVVRPNKIYSICPKNEEYGVVVVGLPHEIAQESGELWTLYLEMPIIVSHDSQDIEGLHHKATLFSGYSLDETNESFDGLFQILNTNSTGTKMCLYCSSKFLEATENDTLVVRKCLLDGTVVIEYVATQEDKVLFILSMAQLRNMLSTGKDMFVVITNEGAMPIVTALDFVEDPSADHLYTASVTLMNTVILIQADSLDPGSVIWSAGHEFGRLCYHGPSTMTIAPVSQYLLNVSLNSNTQYLTNIPTMWANDNPPVFSDTRMVQMSILDGVGTFNSVELNFNSESV